MLFIELSFLVGIEESLHLSGAILHDLSGKLIPVIPGQGLDIKEQLNLPGPLFKDAGNPEALTLCQLEILGQTPKLLVGIGQTQVPRVGRASEAEALKGPLGAAYKGVPTVRVAIIAARKAGIAFIVRLPISDVKPPPRGKSCYGV